MTKRMGFERGTPEAESLYDKLEKQIMPIYYPRPHAFDEIMRTALALNGSFFNTQRICRNTSLTLT